MKKLLLALSFLVIGCTTWAQNVNSFIDICTYGYEDGWSDGYFEKTVLHIINNSDANLRMKGWIIYDNEDNSIEYNGCYDEFSLSPHQRRTFDWNNNTGIHIIKEKAWMIELQYYNEDTGDEVITKKAFKRANMISDIMYLEDVCEEANSGHINFNFINNDTELEVTKGSYTGNIVIPAEVIFNGGKYSVTKIGDGAFSSCSSMTAVTIPSSVNAIGYDAFQGCDGLTSVYITDIVAWLNMSYPVGWWEEALHANPLSYAEHLYLNGNEVNDLIIPNGVTSISSRTFRGFRGLTSVTIPNSVKEIGIEAFTGCQGLTSVTIPKSVTSVGVASFSECGLTSIVIPSSITNLPDNLLWGCDKLMDVYYFAESMPSVGMNIFYGVPTEKSTLHVPSFLIEKYQTTTPWSDFGNIAALPQITYIINDETYKTSFYSEGESVIAETEPSKEGYTFSGWSEIPTTMPAKDVTVTGSFTVNKYTLTYQVDNKTYKTIEVEYGDKIIFEAEPTKEGYTFSGWSEIPATMPAKDVTVNGSFTINKYKLTYKVDDKEYKFYEIEYGTSTIAEGEPSKDGYTFSGWSEIPATMPAKDVTVEGAFIPKKYTLTYIVDGETYKTYEMDCGATLSIEPEPMKEGYTFSGWSEIPATMPARNLSIMGAFIQADDIQEILTVDDTYQIYTIDGKLIEALQKGVNIIRMSDGRIKKVFVK